MNQENQGTRIDKWVQTKYQMPYSLANKLVRLGKIRVNGNKVKADYRIQLNDSIEVKANIIPNEKKEKSKPSPAVYDKLLKLIIENIIFMDEQIIAINKPFGVAVQGGNKIHISLDDILGELKFGYREKPRLAHRIDQHTTGILLLARTKEVAQNLGKQFQDKDVEKRYLAVLVGTPSSRSGTIKSFMEKSKEKIELVHNTESGKEAITQYRILNRISNDLSLVEFSPLTGRTHQIRVHAALNLKCPILGDVKYGGKQLITHEKLHLHASEVRIYALGHKNYDIKADLPKHILDTIDGTN